MQTKFIIENCALLLGGITVFLFGMKLMSEGIESISGGKLKTLLGKVEKSRFLGVGVGLGVTAIIQSSTATNIMLVGLVSAGAISFFSSIAVMMGANIGTTMTAQLVSLSGSELFNITAASSVVAFIGLLLNFSKKPKRKNAGQILLGFGVLFVGIELMNHTIYALKDFPLIKGLFLSESGFILLVNGMLLTGIVQSSSAVTSVLILLGMNGVIDFPSAAFFILGTNIGAGFGVLIVSANMCVEAKKVAVANLLFNIFGSLLFFFPLTLFEKWFEWLFTMLSPNVERQIANFHTFFNLSVTCVLLPFLRAFEKFINFLYAKTKPKTNGKRYKHEPSVFTAQGRNYNNETH